MNKSESSAKSALEWVKIVFDFGVIVVMVFGLRAAYNANNSAREANRLATQALQSGYVPWLKITGIEVTPIEEKKFLIEYLLKNFAQAPALKLEVNTTKPDGIIEVHSYDQEALMPNESVTLSYRSSGPHMERIVKQITTGDEPIQFAIKFFDIFDHKYIVKQEIRYIKNKYKVTNYTVNGVDLYP